MAAQTESIAWIGVGKMGLPIAGRIAGAGYQVTTFDASAERLAAARQHGLTVTASAAEAVAGPCVVLHSVPEDTGLRAADAVPPRVVHHHAAPSHLNLV